MTDVLIALTYVLEALGYLGLLLGLALLIATAGGHK